MHIETVPLIAGALVALLGLVILADAWEPDEPAPVHERRRRPRAERHRAGEAMIGFGVLALAGALVGRDSWRYSTLVVITGTALLVAGTLLNRGFVRELFTNRGPLRRRNGHAHDLPDEVSSDRGEPTERVGEGRAERRRTPRE